MSESERFICQRCGKDYRLLIPSHIALTKNGNTTHFCSKICLLKWLVFSLDSITICEPYKPTPDEVERMSQ
jgi:hypothetical protein